LEPDSGGMAKNSVDSGGARRLIQGYESVSAGK
jgi:hypothetical protein